MSSFFGVISGKAYKCLGTQGRSRILGAWQAFTDGHIQLMYQGNNENLIHPASARFRMKCFV